MPSGMDCGAIRGGCANGAWVCAVPKVGIHRRAVCRQKDSYAAIRRSQTRSYAPASEKSRSRVWTLSIARTFFMVASRTASNAARSSHQPAPSPR